jgi:hypothetical protein
VVPTGKQSVQSLVTQLQKELMRVADLQHSKYMQAKAL